LTVSGWEDTNNFKLEMVTKNMAEIDFGKIERKWQRKWEKDKLFEVVENSKKKKFYVLEMFPYPSGEGLHMGHALNYVIGDVFARFKMMNGFNVLHPMGYDALGLPAENAAIKVGTHPEGYTNNAIKNYVRQQKSLGISYDWSRMVNTADPKYYKWDQWIFLKMLEKGLAYQKKSEVNWCPKCDTVLANEQVHDGKCWRHDDCDVEIKHLKQWFLKISDYADELYDSIDSLDGWPEKTKLMQKNWIGKSHGTEIDFKIGDDVWPIFTTRADTIYGVTFMVISAQHERLMDIVTDGERKKVEKFLKKLNSVSEKDLGDLEKEGVFTGAYAINPANNEKVPVYAGNFVVADYGSGMVMAVPAHDQRDFEFAKKYEIDIKKVIDGKVSKTRAFTGDGKLMRSGEFDGLNNRDAIKKIAKWLGEKKKARQVVNFRLRDWGISRQRYWGTPIPIIHCEKCGAVPVPEKDLPVKLPKDVKFGKGNPLEGADKWMNVKCPKCGGAGRRETDTMDTFVNSSWYFLRYCDPNNEKKIFDSKKANYWCPVDQYIGGAEHACMHLIYFRFYTKFLRDLGLINFDEPAKKLFHQGMLHGEGGVKMSKSKGNVVNPDEVSKKYGIDTARYFLLSLAEPDKPRDWNEKGIMGSLRFVKKIFGTFEKTKIGKSSSGIEVLVNKTIKDVTENIETFRYRMATIKLKELFDAIGNEKEVGRDVLEKSLKLLNPICPHITEELWNKIGGKGFVSVAEWPKVDEKKMKVGKKGEVVDLNGKVVESVGRIFEKVGEKDKVYVYVMPFELSKVDSGKIGKKIGCDVKIFAVSDKKKYDPENKAKNAKPGSPSVYVE
jgi:leucyl-tRNA synthetase